MISIPQCPLKNLGKKTNDYWLQDTVYKINACQYHCIYDKIVQPHLE